jgi:hypothetical protein
MKDIVFLLILGIIACATVIPVRDIYYNSEYDLSQDYSEEINAYGFRLPVIPNDKLDIEIKIKKEDTNNFDGLVYAYAAIPSDEDIQNYGGTSITSISQSMYYEGDYAVYYKTFQVPGGFYYFAPYAIYSTYQPHSYIHVRINLSRYKYSYIKDLAFNTNYEFDTSIFSDGIIPNNYGIFMRLPINHDTIEIQLETKKAYAPNAFKVDVCEFDHLPTSSEVYFGTNAKKCFTNLENKSTENLKYKYPFSSEENVNYISICVTNQNVDLSYIKTNIYKEVGPSPDTGSAEKNNFSKVLLGLLFLILI